MMMGGGYLTCTSCHSPDARGGIHNMMGMQTMDAPDIRKDALVGEIEDEHGNGGEVKHGQGEYDLALFSLTVLEGKRSDGDPLSTDMSCWNMSNEVLAEPAAYLRILH